MNIEYYRNYVSIVEEGNILAASKKQMIAQSALSLQLKKMEDEYGGLLMHRGSRHIELTEAGKILYHKAINIIKLEDAAKCEIEECITGCVGTLSMALPSANTEIFLSSILKSFISKYPHVKLVIHESDSQEAANYVMAGHAEIGFIKSFIDTSYLFDFYRWEQVPLVVIINWGQQIKKIIALKELEGCEIVLPRGCVEVVQTALKNQRIYCNISAITTTRNAAISVAKMKGCLAIVPYDKEEKKRKDIMISSIRDVEIQMPRDFIIAKNSHLSYYAQKFLEIIQR